jgi:cytochrome c oxidase subunit 3
MSSPSTYYIPHDAKWPIVGSIALFLFFAGFASLLNGGNYIVMLAGAALLIYMMFRWFGLVITESESGTYSKQVDVSFRMSMMWFIFSEVMFFAAFFGALFYARIFSGPWLSGIGEGGAAATNAVLWSNFEYMWPTNGPAELGGEYQLMSWLGLPIINTMILLTSGVTVTIAHHAIKENNHDKMVRWLLATVALGFLFVILQAFEYYEAYAHLNLKMTTGIYGSTFFMLTGFHGFHVTMGAIILLVVMLRGRRKHFSATNHFAFEAAAWYWHFVDVVWLGLFIFVYIL